MKDIIIKLIKFILCAEIFMTIQMMVILTIKDFIELLIK